MSLERLAGFAMLFLRLSPDEAWALRFRDLATALRCLTRPSPVPERRELQQLMRQFPDLKKEERSS